MGEGKSEEHSSGRSQKIADHSNARLQSRLRSTAIDIASHKRFGLQIRLAGYFVHISLARLCETNPGSQKYTGGGNAATSYREICPARYCGASAVQ